MAEKLLEITQQASGIRLLSLNRPHALNALNADLMKELEAAFKDAKGDKSVKALLLHGKGKAFCAGADVTHLSTLKDAQGYAFAQFGQSVLAQLENLGKPSLAAIHGFALGGGCELAMAATLRIASVTATFGQPEIKLGIIPGFGGTQRLARLIGKGRALELCLTGRLLKAPEALSFGLVNEVVEEAELLATALARLEALTQLPTLALKSVMETIHRGYNLTLNDALELEALHFSLLCNTEDKEEGVKAFLEKRQPQFLG